MRMLSIKTLSLLVLIISFDHVLCGNKYSKSANEKNSEKVNLRTLTKPFRMNKLNLLWIKAQQRLTDIKLQSLYSDLQLQDKEEITYKRVKSEGKDKEGLLEAELRRKLTQIMTNYGIREHFEDHSGKKQKEHPAFNSAMDDHINRSLFKDKKLNMLWSKAESSGFTSEELAALKEEFQHHQDKVDQYYDLLNNFDGAKDDGFKNIVNEEEHEKFNEVEFQLDTNEVPAKKDYLDAANLVREQHRNIRDGYDRLQRITARGPNNKEFIEPKVQGLWRMAAASNFTVDELESLKVELLHYENRLLKLRNLHAEHVSNLDKHGSKIAGTGDKTDHFHEQQQLIKKHSRKVEKMHADLEGRILARHSEL